MTDDTWFKDSLTLSEAYELLVKEGMVDREFLRSPGVDGNWFGDDMTLRAALTELWQENDTWHDILSEQRPGYRLRGFGKPFGGGRQVNWVTPVDPDSWESSKQECWNAAQTTRLFDDDSTLEDVDEIACLVHALQRRLERRFLELLASGDLRTRGVLERSPRNVTFAPQNIQPVTFSHPDVWVSFDEGQLFVFDNRFHNDWRRIGTGAQIPEGWLVKTYSNVEVVWDADAALACWGLPLEESFRRYTPEDLLEMLEGASHEDIRRLISGGLSHDDEGILTEGAEESGRKHAEQMAVDAFVEKVRTGDLVLYGFREPRSPGVGRVKVEHDVLSASDRKVDWGRSALSGNGFSYVDVMGLLGARVETLCGAALAPPTEPGSRDAPAPSLPLENEPDSEGDAPPKDEHRHERWYRISQEIKKNNKEWGQQKIAKAVCAQCEQDNVTWEAILKALNRKFPGWAKH